MNNLLSRVQAASANQPAWLQEKRQLAATLLTRFSTPAADTAMITAWQQNGDTSQVQEQPGQTVGGLVNLPLLDAVNHYPALCQENLMEKGLFWQESQLNALHLALLNGGRFLYLPNSQQVGQIVELTDDLAVSNYHTLLIMGSRCQLTIHDHRNYRQRTALFAGFELLVGAHSRLSYIYDGQVDSPLARVACHLYQAYGAQVSVQFRPRSNRPLTVDLQDNLDGQGSQAQLTAAVAGNGHRLVVGVDDHQLGVSYQPRVKTTTAGENSLVVRGTYAGDGDN